MAKQMTIQELKEEAMLRGALDAQYGNPANAQDNKHIQRLLQRLKNRAYDRAAEMMIYQGYQEGYNKANAYLETL